MKYPKGTMKKLVNTKTGQAAIASIVGGIVQAALTGGTSGWELIAIGVIGLFGRRSQLPKRNRNSKPKPKPTVVA